MLRSTCYVYMIQCIHVVFRIYNVLFLSHAVTQLTNVSTSGNVSITAGNTHTFMCSATPPSGGRIVTYHWRTPNGGQSVGSSYAISNVSVDDAGTYTCTATIANDGGNIIIVNTMATENATLTVNGR